VSPSSTAIGQAGAAKAVIVGPPAGRVFRARELPSFTLRQSNCQASKRSTVVIGLGAGGGHQFEPSVSLRGMCMGFSAREREVDLKD